MGDKENATRASKGGRARAEALTPAQRSESARRAVAARWARAGRRQFMASLSVASPDAPGTECTNVEVVRESHEPVFAIGDEIWSANSPSYAITMRSTESYTQ